LCLRVLGGGGGFWGYFGGVGGSVGLLGVVFGGISNPPNPIPPFRGPDNLIKILFYYLI
jgi:hypothetical protein